MKPPGSKFKFSPKEKENTASPGEDLDFKYMNDFKPEKEKNELGDLLDIDESAIDMKVQSEQSFVQDVHQVAQLRSPRDMDKSGLTSVKDASLFDVNTFMKSYDSFIYIISGYKEKTLFGVERFDLTKGVWEDMNPLNISRTKFGVVNVG